MKAPPMKAPPMKAPPYIPSQGVPGAYAGEGPGERSGSTATAPSWERTWRAYPESVKEVMGIINDRAVLSYCWDMILDKHESIRTSSTLESAFNKLMRNLIKLVHPDKVASIKGEGVDVDGPKGL